MRLGISAREKGGVPVVADGSGAFDQLESQLLEANAEFQVFPAVELEAGVEESGLVEPFAGDRHITRGKVGAGIIGDFEWFGRRTVKIAGIDDVAVGEEAIGAQLLLRLFQCIDMGLEKNLGHDQITVDKNNNVAFCLGYAQIAGGGGSLVILLEEADVGEGGFLEPVYGAVGGAVIDDDDFVGRGSTLMFQGLQALLQDGLAIVGGDDDA
jgi:hypothetical protein